MFPDMENIKPGDASKYRYYIKLGSYDPSVLEVALYHMEDGNDFGDYNRYVVDVVLVDSNTDDVIDPYEYAYYEYTAEELGITSKWEYDDKVGYIRVS